jgi:hypothetical protein
MKSSRTKMNITKNRLIQIIKEELNELFGSGKKKEKKEYPSSELTALLASIQKAGRMSGIKFESERGSLVDEFESLLLAQGFKINEAMQNRVFIGQEEDIKINSQNAPILTRFLNALKSKNPKIYTSLNEKLKGYRFDFEDWGSLEDPAWGDEDSELEEIPARTIPRPPDIIIEPAPEPQEDPSPARTVSSTIETPAPAPVTEKELYSLG